MIWLKRGKDLSANDKRWMERLSQARLKRYGPPPQGKEWLRQIEEVAAEVKAKHGAALRDRSEREATE